ncbi:MAG: endonuclease NucS [Chloroflexota bacterium]|nr:endonuclease NucS [Chloroflexota bacterium]
MEDIKLWELDGTQATPLGSNNQLESEQGLEDTLVKNPSLLMEGLTLVGRQTHTVGGPLDLLGVDQDGRLVVFELKRGTLSRDAVAQIIDYASDLDRMALAELAEHISENSGVGGIDEIENFQDWYSNRGFDDLGSLKPLRMFLVGLGADDTTERMVKFLAQNSGMDISLLTFHSFDFGGTTILAKQVEVEAPAELGSRSTGRTVSVAEKRERLGRLIEESGMSEQFAAVRNIFREHWPESSTSPQTYGLSIQLRQQAGLGRRASYAYI